VKIYWARTQSLHVAYMIRGLNLCSACWGWVDDPRHVRIGPPVSSDLFAQ
jgi:hypothetical protein